MKRNIAVILAGGVGSRLGTADKPYPVIKVADSTGKVDGDSAATKYTISYTNKVALVPCTA